MLLYSSMHAHYLAKGGDLNDEIYGNTVGNLINAFGR